LIAHESRRLHPSESNARIKPGYDPRLTNEDLAPLKRQTWGQYNIFAFWMSDVHSVGGYIPAVIRGLIAVAWYGIQTYLASAAFMLLAQHFHPGLAPYADVAQHGFVGLSALGWVAFMVMWVLQAFVFWHGMEAIRRFIDWAGPAVYLVMAALCGWLVWKAGWSSIDMRLSGVKFSGWDALPVMLSATTLVVSYFSGPMLKLGDFSRYGKSFDAVKKGNFWGCRSTSSSSRCWP